MVYLEGHRVARHLAPAQVPPPKPLTRVMARSRNGKSGGGGGTETDAYRMEVNEYVPRQDAKDVFDVFLCVTVRDLKTVVLTGRQRRVWIPVTLCYDVVEYLKSCRVATVADSNHTNPASPHESICTSLNKSVDVETTPGTGAVVGGGSYDVSLLRPREFVWPKMKHKVIVETRDGQTPLLRSCLDVRRRHDDDDQDDPNAVREVIELRNSLMGRLMKFLGDVVTRYQPLNKVCSIPSLYSYSGERRFYYDLRETRWGTRLQISQVTDMHRNVIGIPLESVVQFRDRLNQFISILQLEATEKSTQKVASPRRRFLSDRRGARKGSKQQIQRANSNPEEGGNEQGDAEEMTSHNVVDSNDVEEEKEVEKLSISPTDVEE